MKKLKIVSVLLTAAMICSLFSGCMAVMGEVTVNADGSGSMTLSMGTAESMLTEEDLQEALADPETTAFQHNGVTYYGTVETENFSSLDEMSNETGKYMRNPDGSWTMWYNATEEGLGALSPEALEDGAELPKEVMTAIMADFAAFETIRMPETITLIGGDMTGMTLSGNTLTLDLMQVAKYGAYGIRTFTTAKKLPTFSDVAANQWYTPAVTTLALGGMVDGVGNGRFAPAGKLTAAEFCQMVARAAGAEVGADESGYWAAKAIKACLANGIVADRGEVNAKNYGVVITREEAIAGMTLLMTGGLTDEDKTANAELSAQIPDYSQISAQYQELILAAYANGITSGVDANGTFRPMGELSRAEMCQLFYNVGIATVG